MDAIKPGIVVLALALLTVVASACQQGPQETVTRSWVVRYSAPPSGHYLDISFDETGGIHVTGRGADGDAGHYATREYDAAGKEISVKRLLEATIGSPLDEMLIAGGTIEVITPDATGNIYVTGSSDQQGTYHDYRTAKYDSAGNELWVARYDGPVGQYDRAYALAIDDAGNVYVTGKSYADGDNADYATIKYDGAGNQLWVVRYDGPAVFADKADAIAVDGSGNVYVTGWSVGRSGQYDYATIKYSSSGNEEWVARYNGPASGEDLARVLLLDDSGNVYVTGRSDGETSSDYATVKYDSAGNELWAVRYDGPDTSDDHADAMALDDQGNVYVSGWSCGENSCGYTTIKYDSNGKVRWVAVYDIAARRAGIVNAIAIDSAGNVFIVGNSLGSYSVIKYIQTGANPE